MQTDVMATNLFTFMKQVIARRSKICRPTIGMYATKIPRATANAILFGESSMWSMRNLRKFVAGRSMAMNLFLSVMAVV